MFLAVFIIADQSKEGLSEFVSSNSLVIFHVVASSDRRECVELVEDFSSKDGVFEFVGSVKQEFGRVSQQADVRLRASTDVSIQRTERIIVVADNKKGRKVRSDQEDEYGFNRKHLQIKNEFKFIN